MRSPRSWMNYPEKAGAARRASSTRRGAQEQPNDSIATCSCGSGIPVQTIELSDQEKLTLIALPLIFASFRDQKKEPSPEITAEIMHMVAIYNRLAPQQEIKVQSVVAELYREYYTAERLDEQDRLLHHGRRLEGGTLGAYPPGQWAGNGFLRPAGCPGGTPAC